MTDELGKGDEERGGPRTRRSAKQEQVRISAFLPLEVFDALQWLADKRGVTMTEAIRRSISTEVFVEEQLERRAQFILQDEAGVQREIIFR